MNETFNELDLLEILKLLPEGINQGCSNGIESICVKKENGKIDIECTYSTEENKDTTETSFDDSSIKEVVKEFKESINSLDDSVFLEALNTAKEVVNIKRFNDLLNLEQYSETEAIEIGCLMDYFTDVISNILQDKIQNLISLSEKF